MRRRWHDWVIVLSVLTLGGAGVYTLWGEDIKAIFRGPAPAPDAQPAGEPAVAPPSGPAAGPF